MEDGAARVDRWVGNADGLPAGEGAGGADRFGLHEVGFLLPGDRGAALVEPSRVHGCGGDSRFDR